MARPNGCIQTQHNRDSCQLFQRFPKDFARLESTQAFYLFPGFDLRFAKSAIDNFFYSLRPMAESSNKFLTRPPLVDSFGRVHNNLRISVTDRCNIRCFYCMPESNVQFLPRTELLTFEELTRFVSVAAKCGVNKLRLTGGEPLVRSNLSDLVGRLAKIDGIQDIALTTNGLLLADYAQPLFEAGLHRLNVSLDGLSEATFQKISRRSGLEKVLAGIDKAIEIGFKKIRLNAVSIAGITEPEIIPLAQFARAKKLELRFIEFMPLDADKSWASDQVLSGEQIKAMIESEIGSLVPAERVDKSQPSMDFDFADGNGRIGFINPISQPFCSDCNRIRITAEGKFRNCLFSTSEWDLRKILREGGTDADIEAAVRDSIGQKKAAHGIDSDAFVRPEKAMFQIGG